MIPVVKRWSVTADPSANARAEKLAAQLQSEQPGLIVPDALRPLVPDHVGQGLTIHIEDLSAIPVIDRFSSTGYLEDRARIRAVEGDIVISGAAACPSYERYFAGRLKLGRARWLHPRSSDSGTRRLASAAWRDGAVRDALCAAVHEQGAASIHPYMGSKSIWTLAVRVAQGGPGAVSVLAPHPALTRAVNDKLWFADVVARLFGTRSLPLTRHVYGIGALTRMVRVLGRERGTIVVKLPDSAGGAGNLVLDTASLPGADPKALERMLFERLRPMRWDGRSRLLVGRWDAPVQTTPSAQLWIPPESQGAPVVEGLFEQLVDPEFGRFYGARNATLGPAVEEEFVARSWLLGYLYQRLGYVGRCSFDAIVVGDGDARGRLEFIECNGRWGGTSAPMTLVNRLPGTDDGRTFVSFELDLEGLGRIDFETLLDGFGDELFDPRTGLGRYVFMNSGALAERSGVDAIVLGVASDPVCRNARTELLQRLQSLVPGLSASAPRPC